MEAGCNQLMKINKKIAVVSYLSMLIFAGLIAYILIFLAGDNSSILSNPYNAKRQDLLAQRVSRGEILSCDGKVIAQTVTEDDGEEKRYYPYDNMYAHAVGYIERGKTGIEQTYNYYMLTSNINPVFSAINELKGKKSPGDNIITTLDSKLQKTAYDALADRRGAVVVMEPYSGKILAMVSKPDFNPNLIDKNWKLLTEDDSGEARLLNRATQGLYPPGSTFKLLTLLEYIKEHNGIDDFSYLCKGSEHFLDSSIRCYKTKKHGQEDMKKAFAKSCNCAFAKAGLDIDVKGLKSLADDLLFNKALGCKFEYKSSSFSLSKKSTEDEIVQTVIGQGKTMVSPLHNAILASMIANGGRLVKPFLVDRVETADGKRTIRTFENKETQPVLTQMQVSIAEECMREVVKSGTAASLSQKEYKAAGKTGSAEYGSSGKSHAWFIGYAEKDNRKLAVSIIVEGAGTGSDYAVPIAGKIFDTYY